ncbi:MAG: polyphosphate polymerase domain-containing protein [Clostridiales bacterium]|nr:polyphosphate polymerase domain-containing protein [Clostridiales bacterium]
MAAFRHELKYLIPYSQKDILIRKFLGQGMLHTDPHAVDGSYLIRSLYFDDHAESAYEEKQMGIAARKKYRIRFYDYNDNIIHLEKKIKQGSYIRKESASLSRAETDAVLSGDYSFLLKRKESLCQEFYVECVSNLLRPTVIVDYDREPYILDAGTVRITFDEHIRAAVGSLEPFDSTLPSFEVLPEGCLIMEVKFTEFLPDFIRLLLPQDTMAHTQASKYVMCLEIAKKLHQEILS